ncbi:8-amino-7-oxononanoate synthase [Porphyromonas sp.]|uniref:aminotransferase class I/II-fold pyridoxal phosphate-dependent enzyme n=1 Tax=Porphyromonas sp. TaxID=1924944 RepID=UPI0026DA7756|nr:8-amino-7-oxononanoate synthase [Porphyromonas sp.]MDO4771585.1 8-amino-7-oxononanoate synthase [Porphyromonas sp.]
MKDKYTHYDEQVSALRLAGLERTLPELSLSGKYVSFGGRILLNLSGNGYLGLSDHSNLRQGFDPWALQWTSASSRLLTGNDKAYVDFESLLVEAYGADSALVWGSGYHANSGLIPVIADGNTLIVADRLVHASIIEGIKLSKSDFVRFRHNDMAHLHSILEDKASSYDRVWIITEALFSMDGDPAPLREIVKLKHAYPNTFLYVDEAHSVGVFGDKGLGLSVQERVFPDVDILVGTLGKALGSVGAYSLQPGVLRDLAISTARPFIYSTALPPISIAWGAHLFKKMMQMDDRRRQLRELMSYMSVRLGMPVCSQIIPIIVPGNDRCAKMADQLIDLGYYVRPIRKPTVPEGQERIRLSLSADMTIDELSVLCDHLISLKHEMDLP